MPSSTKPAAAAAAPAPDDSFTGVNAVICSADVKNRDVDSAHALYKLHVSFMGERKLRTHVVYRRFSAFVDLVQRHYTPESEVLSRWVRVLKASTVTSPGSRSVRATVVAQRCAMLQRLLDELLDGNRAATEELIRFLGLHVFLPDATENPKYGDGNKSPSGFSPGPSSPQARSARPPARRSSAHRRHSPLVSTQESQRTSPNGSETTSPKGIPRTVSSCACSGGTPSSSAANSPACVRPPSVSSASACDSPCGGRSSSAAGGSFAAPESPSPDSPQVECTLPSMMRGLGLRRQGSWVINIDHVSADRPPARAARRLPRRPSASPPAHTLSPLYYRLRLPPTSPTN